MPVLYRGSAVPKGQSPYPSAQYSSELLYVLILQMGKFQK